MQPILKCRIHKWVASSSISLHYICIFLCVLDTQYTTATSATASRNEQNKLITICSIKRKENFFSLVFFRVLKRAVLARVRRVEGGGTSAKTALFSTRTKKQWKKVFSFFEHAVLFYETPFLHRAGTIYLCGQSEEVSSSGGSSLF
jgi:hypothetical protein